METRTSQLTGEFLAVSVYGAAMLLGTGGRVGRNETSEGLG